jgi:predicted HAD superfamily Cof-like phosphohydrolase
MSITADIYALQAKYGFNHEPLNADKLTLRVDQIEEEFNELLNAFLHKDAEEFVDACIDISVFALGTLALLGVDIDEAWAEVHAANMSKVRGVKEGREHSGGWDLIKPKGWEAPDHAGNTGFFSDALSLRTMR